MKKDLTANIIRYIAAILVIFSHAFAIAQNKIDYLATYTNNIVNIGAFSVSILFCLSGFYIMKSIDEKGTKNFVKKRILRLIPSLFVVVILSILILGLFFSKVSVFKYFTSFETYKYLLNILFIPIHNLPGVFENNIYNSTVNGALWTMMVQFLCYIYIYLYFRILYYRKKEIVMDNKITFHYLIVSFILGLFGLFVFKKLGLTILIAMIRPFLCFVIGGVLYHIDLKNLYFTSAILLSVISLLINNYISLNIWLIVFMSYIVIWLLKNIKLSTNNKAINYIFSCSYELYLVGFPIQQAISNMNGGSMNIYYNFVLSLFVAIIFSLIVKMISDKLIKISNI